MIVNYLNFNSTLPISIVGSGFRVYQIVEWGVKILDFYTQKKSHLAQKIIIVRVNRKKFVQNC